MKDNEKNEQTSFRFEKLEIVFLLLIKLSIFTFYLLKKTYEETKSNGIFI